MANTWKLSADLVSTLDTARSMLDDELSELRSRWDEQPERWQDSDRGTTVGAWLDELDLVGDALDTVESKPAS